MSLRFWPAGSAASRVGTSLAPTPTSPRIKKTLRVRRGFVGTALASFRDFFRRGSACSVSSRNRTP